MKDLSWLKTEYIAHRGLYTKDQEVPENSMLAFQLALEKGYAIELDVNLTKDQQVVCFHDYQLNRMCDQDIIIDQVDYKDIKDFTLKGSDQTIPLLSDVLNLVNGKKPLLIELKPHGNVDQLTYYVVDVLKDYQGPYALFSFHPMVVSILKRFYPDIIRGQIAESFKDNKNMRFFSKYMLKSMVFNRQSKPDFISYGINDLPNKYCDRAKKKGLVVISYAAQNQEAFDFVKTHYDNVVFEFFEPQKP